MVVNYCGFFKIFFLNFKLYKLISFGMYEIVNISLHYSSFNLMNAKKKSNKSITTKLTLAMVYCRHSTVI